MGSSIDLSDLDISIGSKVIRSETIIHPPIFNPKNGLFKPGYFDRLRYLKLESINHAAPCAEKCANSEKSDTNKNLQRKGPT